MPLSDDQLKRILDQEIESAIGASGGELSANRAEAMDFYLSEATGDLAPPDVAGRSQVVSSDLSDVIEWVKPQLIKAFMSSDEAIRFDAVGEEDEDGAEQESDYVNHVFLKENQGFLVYYSWFMDALLQKVGTVTTYWEDSKKVTTEQYTGLTDMELAALSQDDEIEMVEHTEQMAQGLMGEPVMLHDVTIKRTTTQGRAVVEPVPPEEFLVNADHNSIQLQSARFVAHETIKTASELVEMGFDQKQIDLLPSYDTDPDSDDRNTTTDEHNHELSVDPAMRQIKVYVCYPLVDYDEDGVAERRRVLYVKGSEILENDEADCVPFAALTPYVMPHRFMGLSIHDKIREIMVQKTSIWRSILDNFYLSNNQRVEVDINKVNLDDLAVNRPGGIVRSKQIGSVQPIPVMPLGAAGYQALEYMDKTREERSGVGPNMMGQNINVSGDTAHGIERMMTAKEELIGLIAKVFAETGVRDMFLQLHALLMKHQDKEKVAKLRGTWVQVNPADWKERTSMTLKIGGGEGERMKKRAALDHVLMAQEKLVGSNLLTKENIYNALTDSTKLSGLQDQGRYFTDPKTAQPKQPQPDPTQQALELQQQVEMQKAKNDQQKLGLETEKVRVGVEQTTVENQLRAREIAIKEQELELDARKLALDASEAEIGNEVDREKNAITAAAAADKITLEREKLALVQQNREQDAVLSGERELAEELEQKRQAKEGAIMAWIKDNGSPRLQGLADQLMNI
ncbi:MAG: hypothetical protein GY753_07700 [Gammaproteobacteria bacterium]|nr:hypothetical protein [Gammaproteobacteria bacterium]